MFRAAALTLLVLAACAGAGPSPAADEPPLATSVLYSQDFERTPLGGPPYPVADNSGWAGSTVPLAVVASGDPRYGKLLEARVSGYCQLVLGQMAMRQGALYRVSLDLSSRGPQTVTLILRLGPGPYTTYVSSLEKTNEELQRFTFLGRGVADAGNVLLMLLMNGSTTLGLDNIKIEEVTGALPAGDPPAPGNLLPNAGFELLGNGWFLRGRTGFAGEGACEGAHALRLANYAVASSSWLPLSMEGDYRVGARVRSLSPQANVRVQVSNWMFPRGGGGKAEGFTVRADEGWRNVGFTWRPPAPQGKITRLADYYFQVVCASPEGAEVLVDAAEVKALLPGTEADRYAPRTPLELAITTDAPYGVATAGATVQVTVLATAPTPPTLLQVRDEQGRTVQTVPLRLHRQRARVALRDLQPGYWQLLTCPVGATSAADRREGETFLAVAPAMPELPAERWLCGTHIPDAPDLRAACFKLGLRWDRLHDTAVWTKWPAVAPERDRWVFDDDAARRFRGEGHSLLGLLDRVPQWLRTPLTEAEGKQRLYLREEELAAWENYCRRTVEHFGGQVDAWEILNEPYGSVSPAEYLKVLQAAYRGVKAANAGATVVGLGGSGPCDPWLTECLKLGAGRYCDAISFHGYGATIWGTVTGPGRLIGICDGLRAALREAGTPEVAIWDSECGPSVEANFSTFSLLGGEASPDDAARMFPKSVAAATAAGLTHVLYYSGHEKTHAGDGGAGMYLTDLNHTVRRCAVPLAVANAFLEGRRFVRQVPHAQQPDLVELLFEGRGETVRMLWSNGPGLRAKLQPGERPHSMWGRALVPDAGRVAVTAEPVYLLRPGGRQE